MPSHFGRLRVLNDTPPGVDARSITKTTYKIGTPQVLYTVVGFGTQFPEVPEQFYAELPMEPGAVQGDEVFVDIVITDPATGTTLDILNWSLQVAPAVLITSVDIKVLHRTASPNNYRARATVAGDNFAFKELNQDF